MLRKTRWIRPEQALGALYGRTSRQLGIGENRRDEVITAAIFASFRNQEFGTNLRLPADYREIDRKADAEGIDIVLADSNGRYKKLQIKGIHIQRSIERRKLHKTRGTARVRGRKTQKQIQADSAELSRIMHKELKKIIQDYSGLVLIFNVSADFASQTSLERAIHKNSELVEQFKAREVWFLRNIPVRAVHGRNSTTKCHAYKLIKVLPDHHTYGFSFAL